MRIPFKSNNPENQRGVAAVEFAIVLPLLLFLFIGITEFGIAYYNKQVITNASREGARAGINAEDIEDAVQKYAQDRLITFGNYSPPSATTDDIVVNDTEYLSVSVTFNYTYLILAGFRFFGADFGQTLNIGASTTMKKL